jgi:hypothetical protein
MFSHEFNTVEHWSMGPCIGRTGCIYYVAKIDSCWILRCYTQNGTDIFQYYPSYDTLKSALKAIDRAR